MQKKIDSVKESIADVVIGNLISAIIVFEAHYFFGIEIQSSLILWIQSNAMAIPLSYARRRWFNANLNRSKNRKKPERFIRN